VQRDWPNVDYYAVLGVAPTSTQSEITHAFHQAARRSHPDAHPGSPTAEERFKRIAAAYEVLDDPVTRAEYDQVRGIASSAAAAPADDLWQQWPPTPRVDVEPQRANGWRRVRPRWLPSPLSLLVVGSLTIAIALTIVWQQQRIPDGWITTPARVTDVRETQTVRGSRVHKNITYTPRGGQTVTRSYHGPADLGDRLRLAYDPDDPVRHRALDDDWVAAGAFGIAGAVLLASAAAVAIFTVPSPRLSTGTRLR
jgi:hypothetical protein